MLNSIMNSETVLRLFGPQQHTIMIGNGAPQGTAASICQVDKEGVWVAGDYASRGLSFSKAFVRCVHCYDFPKSVFLTTFSNYLLLYISNFAVRLFLLIISRVF